MAIGGGSWWESVREAGADGADAIDGFPVFARGLCIRGTGKDYGAVGWIGAPVLIGDVAVQAGDLVVGDGDGVVVVPRARAAEVVDKARRREADEVAILERLAAGESTMAVYGFH
jgi:4-hydroxy-4-methyl-2-oxoglutarate aldolase